MLKRLFSKHNVHGDQVLSSAKNDKKAQSKASI